MNLILFLIFGLAVGVVARFLVPGRESGGWMVSIVLGIAGSFAGAILGRVLGFYRDGEFAGFVMSVVGAAILLVLYHAFAGHRTTV
jgi:uncharacterized membrane protein YeaQ/YmgE (transglycosylase-associated protein family)